MSKRWKRPTRAEIAKIRAECKERGISAERAGWIVADARRSPEEAERHGQEEVATLEAEWAERPSRSKEELHAWHDEFIGYRPPRKLPAEAALYHPGWDPDFRKRKPFAPLPWFCVESADASLAYWDGRCFVVGGWEEVEPRPRGHHDGWRLALLYPSARDCLDAAVQVSAATGRDHGSWPSVPTPITTPASTR